MAARKMHPPERVATWVEAGAWNSDTVQQLFADRVREYGDELAVVDPPNKQDFVDVPLQRPTWNQLSDQVDRLAAVLRRHGVGEGDILAVQLPNTVELVAPLVALANDRGWAVELLAPGQSGVTPHR